METIIMGYIRFSEAAQNNPSAVDAGSLAPPYTYWLFIGNKGIQGDSRGILIVRGSQNYGFLFGVRKT